MVGSQNRNELTAGQVLEGAVISPSLFAISHNAERISVAWSRSPSTKLSILLLMLARVTFVVESSIQTYASWLTYRLLISSYLYLCRYTVNFSSKYCSPGRESAERLFSDVALPQFTAHVVQSEGLQGGNVVLLWRFVRYRMFRADCEYQVQTLSARR